MEDTRSKKWSHFVPWLNWNVVWSFCRFQLSASKLSNELTSWDIPFSIDTKSTETNLKVRKKWLLASMPEETLFAVSNEADDKDQ